MQFFVTDSQCYDWQIKQDENFDYLQYKHPDEQSVDRSYYNNNIAGSRREIINN